MVTATQAKVIAQAFVKTQGEILPGLYYAAVNAAEYATCFFFDFSLVDKDGEALKEPPMVGGAPGFTVDKETGKVEVVSWATLALLGKYD